MLQSARYSGGELRGWLNRSGQISVYRYGKESFSYPRLTNLKIFCLQYKQRQIYWCSKQSYPDLYLISPTSTPDSIQPKPSAFATQAFSGASLSSETQGRAEPFDAATWIKRCYMLCVLHDDPDHLHYVPLLLLTDHHYPEGFGWMLSGVDVGDIRKRSGYNCFGYR